MVCEAGLGRGGGVRQHKKILEQITQACSDTDNTVIKKKLFLQTMVSFSVKIRIYEEISLSETKRGTPNSLT